ncbi:MAG: hypothetical protein HONBIEJF_01447 [Fimbriimonadaceae bacterium]|nr:hypothetical protein [Fimbriimonadaceae bacterium]
MKIRFISTALAAGIAAIASAQVATGIYTAGRTLKDQGISVSSWGSGQITETDDIAVEGTTSIRISTRNYFQGGIIRFAKPVDLSQLYADKNNLLMLTVRLADSSVTLGSGGKTGGGSNSQPGSVGTGGGGKTGAGNPGGIGNEGSTVGGGKTGGSGTDSSVSVTAAPLRSLRLIFTTSDGMKSECYVDAMTSAPNDRGWRNIAVPLQAIAGLGRTNKAISDIVISGDSTATFYLGEMVVINDSTPIYAELQNTDMNLALGDEVEFRGYGSAGSSVLVYSWDFDASDGVAVDAEGMTVKRKFRKPGKFVVTLTVSDKFGLKEPKTSKVTIEVNP